ncbi:glycosyltransferase family 4 protein [Micromonospora terminaliae]|uniref:Glycosyltransferase family 4 protein n=1 Tax=Micromonospora terminaliae TaxID=1914461 RepID=A0AAJ2ZJ55_9ACTN|nr:glycosyltransferase family 4 protein [Micromonospora terminaliae]NES31015.1 glycosyltransferase family 4 protein [Micromonospora terminaliae]
MLVFNQYAKPLSEPGGTRHIELFGRLDGWDYLIVTGDRDYYSRQRVEADQKHFKRVRVSDYEGNNHRRVLNWLTYCLGALATAFRPGQVDVVYASSPHILTPVAGWLAARMRRARFVLEIRDLWPDSMVDLGHLRPGSLTHRALKALEVWLYRRADRIVIVAAGWHEYLAALGIERAKVEWVSNGAEPADFDLRPDDCRPLRDRLPVHGKLFVYTGAHGPANGLDALLDAAAELPDHTFALIGDGIEKPRLVERATGEGLTNVHFLDMIPKRELAGIIGAADVGIHVLADAAVFRHGASPNKLYDYLAAGLPVVTNCPGDPHDIVYETGAGMAVDSSDLVAGIRKITELDSSSLREMGRRGRRYIQENRSRTVMAGRLQRVLDSVLPARQ